MPKNKNHELDKSRFDEPFYQNYDLYETKGVDDKIKQGPGTGFYQHMSEYKSVSDFLKKIKKKKKKSKKAELRIKLLKSLAIDFPLDESIKNPIETESTEALQSLPFSGIGDNYFSLNDQEDKDATKLNIGRDYQNDDKESETIEDFLEKINPSEPPLLGLPDGLEQEDKSADQTISNRSQDYGTTNSGNTLYDKKIF